MAEEDKKGKEGEENKQDVKERIAGLKEWIKKAWESVDQFFTALVGVIGGKRYKDWKTKLANPSEPDKFSFRLRYLNGQPDGGIEGLVSQSVHNKFNQIARDGNITGVVILIEDEKSFFFSPGIGKPVQKQFKDAYAVTKFIS